MNFTLWPACVKVHPFREQLRAAATAGFDRLPVGPLTWKALQAEGFSAGDVRRMAGDEGVALGHYDGFAMWAPYDFSPYTPDAARAVFDVSQDDCLRICDSLGLPAICTTGLFDAHHAELAQLVDAFGAFCERAAAHGIQVDLEFIPFWGVPDLAAAWSIVRDAGCGNAAVMVDSWHFCRGNPDFDLLEAMPAGSIRTVQLADAAFALEGDDLFEDCLRFRRCPGEGDLPLARFVEVLVRKGGITDVGPEVFADSLDRLAATSAAELVAAGCRRLLAPYSRMTDSASSQAGELADIHNA